MRIFLVKSRGRQWFTVCIGMLLFVQPSHVFATTLDPQFASDNNIIYYDPSAQSCISAPDPIIQSVGELTIPKDFSLGTDNKRRAVNLAKQLMKDYNLKDFQAAGVVGNFVRESGGQHVPPNVNEGGNVGPPAFKGGYGWAQWTGGRQVSFIDYAVTKGYMQSKSVDATDAANYAYLNHELVASSESRVISELKKTTDTASATDTWERVYERAGVKATKERIDAANKVLSGLRGDGNMPIDIGIMTDSSPIAANTNGCAVANTATQVGGAMFEKVTFPLLGTKSTVTNSTIFKDGTTDRGGHPYIAFDILAKAGTKVVAFTDGVVTNESISCYGQSVSVYNEKTGLVIFYQHMSAGAYVKTGDKVIPGDPIGKIASVSEYADVVTPHLHIDASKGRYRVACNRSSCSEATKALFVDIGPDLFTAYQKLGG